MKTNYKFTIYLIFAISISFMLQNCKTKAPDKKPPVFDVSLIKGNYKLRFDEESLNEYVVRKSKGSAFQEMRHKGNTAAMLMSELNYNFKNDSVVHIKNSGGVIQKDVVTKWRSDGRILTIVEDGKDINCQIEKLVKDSIAFVFPSRIKGVLIRN